MTRSVLEIFLIGAFAFALRAMVSLHPYSGQNKSPMFGDYEAQRHWQEICVNLPIKQWYKNSSDNDLLYWGLDYPPLTAYHSFLVGRVAQCWNSSFVELHKSRGISTDEHKNFMRLTVLASDFFLYIPSILICTAVIHGTLRKQPFWKVFMISVVYPGQILIDNGHFQYNNMSLGLALLAVAAIFRQCDILATILFSLALNYKQMELYHALPFFIYLLRRCFLKGNFSDGIRRLAMTGFTVLATFLVLWLPWASVSSNEDLLSVVKRIFPFDRGIFEDKVSNLWCALNVLIKIKILFENKTMALISLVTTLLSLLPSSIHLFRYPKQETFLYALINCSLGFFLFSFQVHEKSILLPTLPIVLIYPLHPFASLWFLQISTFSMFPLFVKDGLTNAFTAVSILYFYLSHFAQQHVKQGKSRMKYLYYISCTLSVILAVCHVYVNPPDKLPHLFPLGISVFSFIHFKVTDESDGCGGRFNCVVVSPMFEGKKLLQRHRLVNRALAEELKTIHAFSQKTFTPAEWEVSKF